MLHKQTGLDYSEEVFVSFPVSQFFVSFVLIFKQILITKV